MTFIGGTVKFNVGTTALNVLVPFLNTKYPLIDPSLLTIGHWLSYEKTVPGPISGVCPTTPGPCTTE